MAGSSGSVEAMLDHPLITHHLVCAHLKLQCLAFQKAAAMCQNILDMVEADPVKALQMQMNCMRWCKKETAFKNSKIKSHDEFK
jgi:uncharacterized protein (DUF2237 family)